VPEYFAVLREGGEAPKVVVCFRIIQKKIQISLLRRLGSETTDFCLIRARKMAQLVGLDRSKQKPYLQRNHTFSRIER